MNRRPSCRDFVISNVLATCAIICLLLATEEATRADSPAAAKPQVQARVEVEYGSLFEFYKDLHSHPELSFHEERTSKQLADKLRAAGLEVTEKIGGHGVVGVLRNGNGPVALVRADMDALPVKEQSGMPHASRAKMKDEHGRDVDVMHACGHDVHMTCLVGTARVLAALKDRWQGTVVFIGQPAEERIGGARRMLADGLFRRFPKPDFCIAQHVSGDMPAGTIGYTEGFALANSDAVDIVVHGAGGHGAMPHKTRDPIVLAAQIVLALQTIVSRETEPVEPSVVTVGSIHGGAKHNIIPDEVRLQLTLRSYSEAVREQQIAAIKRITRGLALAAGLPEERVPEVSVAAENAKATYNDPPLTQRLMRVFGAWFGKDTVKSRKASMGAEDFGLYGRTKDKIPICMFWLGSADPKRVAGAERSGQPLPSLHSPLYAPLPEPTIKTGVTAMTAAVLELLGKH
ncbi:MAG: amidohydrolase [Verrucomicrobia bacterium]|nr:amidohydrolase [Verrucomicrobiota bacterium]